jgi:demethylmacrocin O-methyltransferase
MWSAFFRDGSQIYGIDVERKNLSLPDNVHIFQFKQDDHYEFSNICKQFGPFDIIIDDASHNCPLTEQTFNITWQCVANDGFYVVEVI